ncbi:hypothetical protein PSR1_04336 [Anaeromyxobacter sp. PSR-1]|nr:hypothetical protein PSR1_04336 [Anaeromyxobacter sp. PSR-1]
MAARTSASARRKFVNSNCGRTTARFSSSKVKPMAASFRATACVIFSARTSPVSRSSTVMDWAWNAPSTRSRARRTRQRARYRRPSMPWYSTSAVAPAVPRDTSARTSFMSRVSPSSDQPTMTRLPAARSRRRGVLP